MFNDGKVSAHHAIIPTPARTNISAMSEIELNLYDAIRRFYIAQFYSEFEFSKTVIEVQSGRHLFAASGKTPTKQGWKVLFTSDSESDPKEEGEDVDALIEQEKLPRVSQGEPALLKGADLANKMTRPAPPFHRSHPLGRNGEHRQIRDRGEVQADPQRHGRPRHPSHPSEHHPGCRG